MNRIKLLSDKSKDKLYAALAVIVSLIVMLIGYTIAYIMRGGEGDFFTKVYDAYYYEWIAKYGYNESGIWTCSSPNVDRMFNGKSVWAFFPLVPLIVKILHTLTFGVFSYMAIATFFSTVCMGFALYFIIQFLRKRNIKINYLLVSIIFLANTFFAYYFTFYTEAFFMCILALFLNFCEEKRWILSGVCLALLTATRVTGVVFIVYMFCKMFTALKVVKQNGKCDFWATIFNFFKNPTCILAICISPLGIVLFMLALKYVWGLSPIAFLDAQAGWGDGKVNKCIFVRLWQGFTGGLGSNKFFNACFVVLSIWLCVYLIVKKKRYLTPILMGVFIVYTGQSSLASLSRYVLAMLLLSIEFYELAYDTLSEKSKKSRWFGLKKTIVVIILVFFVATALVSWVANVILCKPGYY